LTTLQGKVSKIQRKINNVDGSSKTRTLRHNPQLRARNTQRQQLYPDPSHIGCDWDQQNHPFAQKAAFPAPSPFSSAFHFGIVIWGGAQPKCPVIWQLNVRFVPLKFTFLLPQHSP
jgi:hypothetical protein